MKTDLLNYKILFVEDDPLILENYIEGLKYSFETVFSAKDGFSAYEIYKTKKPDIIILDINIPKMTGLEFLKKIREKDLNTKVIFFTSYSDKDTLLEASVLKINKYLIKPIKRKELLSAIDECIKELKAFEVVSKKILHLSDDYYWDFDSKNLYSSNNIIKLTKKEKDILDMVFTKNGVITYDEILFNFWEDNSESNLKILKTFMSTIRKKLPENTIINEYGVGYRFLKND